MPGQICRIIWLAFFIFLAGQSQAQGETMELTSPAFKHNQFIPPEFTCQGEDINPELMISNLPAQTKSLALIVDDPDAPGGVWVHWVVFNIAPVSRIPANSVPGTLGGNTDGGKKYHGPCPPSGVHRYFFKLYAIDALLNLKEGVSKGQLEQAMQGHILASAQLIGLYKK